MSLHMNCQAAKGFNGYAMQHQTDSKYMYVLTHVCMGKLCSVLNNIVPSLMKYIHYKRQLYHDSFVFVPVFFYSSFSLYLVFRVSFTLSLCLS